MTEEQLTGALICDVETQSVLNLLRVGTHRYVAHPETRLLVATFGFVASNDAPLIWLPGEPFPAIVAEHLTRGGIFAAWNVLFDAGIMNRFMPQDIPRIDIPQMHDIAAQAASANMPRSVDKCASAMELPVNKDPLGLAAMHYFKAPRKWVDGMPVWGVDPVRFQHLVRYCQTDTVIERLLMRSLPRLQELDRPVCEQDMLICQRGMLVDHTLIEIGGPALMQALAEANRRLVAMTQGAIRGVTKREDFVRFLVDQGVELVRPEEVTKEQAAIGKALDAHGDLLEASAIDPESVVGEEELEEGEKPFRRYELEIHTLTSRTANGGNASEAGEDDNEGESEEAEPAKPSTKGALTKSAVLSYLARDNLPEIVRQVLEIRREYGRTSTAKLKTLAGTLSPADGRTRDYLTYHAAGTGRAGGRLIQPQNLPRDSVPPDAWAGMLADLAQLSAQSFQKAHGIGVVTAIVRLIRGAIIASEGHVLAGGDFSRIELVVGAWLSDATTLLRDLGRGVDTYVQMAMAIYDCGAQAVDKDRRQVGKSAMLGCIFGLGAPTFQTYVYTTTRVEIDEEVAAKTINLFRSTYYEFPEAWRDCGNAAIRAVAYPGTVQECLGSRVVWRCTPDRSWLLAELPSGRRLRYRKPTLNEEENRFGQEQVVLRCWGVSSRTHQWTNEAKHGSLLFQNCVQAIARDLIMDAVSRMESAGYPVILHVHDELLCEVPASLGITPRIVHRVMTEKPSWASALPIDAECWVSTRYGKLEKEKILAPELE